MADRRSSRRRSRLRPTILVPALPQAPIEELLALARMLQADRRIMLLGMVPVDSDRSLSKATIEARELRAMLRREAGGRNVLIRPKVLVSHHLEYELSDEIAEHNVELMLLPWGASAQHNLPHLQAMLDHVPCDAAALTGSLPPPGSRLLAVLRSGPDSELALRLVLQLAASADYQITTLRLADESGGGEELTAFEQVVEHLPFVQDALLLSDDPLESILDEAADVQLLAIGASSHGAPADGLTSQLVHRFAGPLLIARTKPVDQAWSPDRLPGMEAISILVDKWFAQNTYHADEFGDLAGLVQRKEALGQTISLALPALNEEETVGNVIRTIQRALQEELPLVDEIVLMDSNSSDRTREIAENLGVPVYIHQQILPQYGARDGKGEALWKSLYVTRGDLVLWIDTDIVNFHPRFVYGLIGPLLLRPDLMFVKGFYLRPMRVGETIQAGGGGRVTELAARPLLNLFYPALSGLIQPLSGEYAGRRKALETLPFSSGYGVETGLLIDLLEQHGLNAIAQVDMVTRIHHNQPLAALSLMSFAIIQTVMRKLDRKYGLELLKDINRSMKIVRHQKRRYFLEVKEIGERERPPMASVVEYRQRMQVA